MLTIDDLRERFDCGRGAVISWIESGLLPAVDVSPFGSKRRQYRISEEALRQFELARAAGAKPSRPVSLKPVKQWV
jgi:hypothetical protein